MASFNTAGLEGLELAFDELADIPDSVLRDMLIAEAQVLADAQKKGLEAQGLKDSGQLMASIYINTKVKKKKDSSYVLVYPKGQRKKTGDSIAKPSSNGAVGYVNEYGAPHRHIRPRQWMRIANETSIDKAVKAAERVYDRYLKSKRL